MDQVECKRLELEPNSTQDTADTRDSFRTEKENDSHQQQSEIESMRCKFEADISISNDEPTRHKHFGRTKVNKKDKRAALAKKAEERHQQELEKLRQDDLEDDKEETKEELALRQELDLLLFQDGTSCRRELSLFHHRRSTRVPPCLFDCTVLHSTLLTLDLSRNEMKKLPPSMNLFTSLTHLNVSRNKLRRLPNTIGELTQLHTINASSNDFRTLETLQLDAIKTLPALRLLDVQFCPRLAQYGSDDIERLSEFLGERVECILTQQTVPPEKKLHAANRDASLLRSQILPHSTGALRRRLALVYGDTTDPELVVREEVIERLLAAHELDNGYGGKGGPRAARHIQGVKVKDEQMCLDLKVEMDKWVASDIERRKIPGEIHRERTNVDAQHYMILKSPRSFSTTENQETVEDEDIGGPREYTSAASQAAKQAAAKVGKYSEMWRQAVELLATHDADFATKITAIAFTKNFIGSCHIDTENTGPFYGLALGDFVAPGGRLCVEVSAREVAHVDTRHRFAKVDGRFPHWVAPSDGDRYSVIYYQTRGDEIPRTTAVFAGNDAPLMKDPPTFPAPGSSYYACYDRATGKYEPDDWGPEKRGALW